VVSGKSDIAAGHEVAADRKRLLAELSAYQAYDAREIEMLERLRAFVAEYATCFERTLAVGHVTGSAWVVNRELERVLLTHHRKLDKWLQLGGHADGDGDIRRVALREATEESGVRAIVPAGDQIYDVDVHEIPSRGAEAAHFHYDVRFAFFADPQDELHVSEESHEVAWIPLAGIERLPIDDSIRRLVAKTAGLAGCGCPAPLL
jgi:8-oxo-dGTP pyrophosphatase MutT (NUDIX family)